MHFLLFYEFVPDYLDRRAQYRTEHLRSAWESQERGELVLAGALADRFGFRRTLMCAYLILTAGYFLLGSLETSWMAPLRNAVGDTWLVSLVLLVPALGPGMVKPCVAGTIARTSTEKVRSLGYSIYYTLVNIGGAAGPLVASYVHQHLRVESVFRVADRKSVV